MRGNTRLGYELSVSSWRAKGPWNIITHEVDPICVYKDLRISHSLDGLTALRPTKQEKMRLDSSRFVYLNFGFGRLAMEHVWSPRPGTEQEHRRMS